MFSLVSETAFSLVLLYASQGLCARLRPHGGPQPRWPPLACGHRSLPLWPGLALLRSHPVAYRRPRRPVPAKPRRLLRRPLYLAMSCLWEHVSCGRSPTPPGPGAPGAVCTGAPRVAPQAPLATPCVLWHQSQPGCCTDWERQTAPAGDRPLLQHCRTPPRETVNLKELFQVCLSLHHRFPLFVPS